jgi:hypothetical protein
LVLSRLLVESFPHKTSLPWILCSPSSKAEQGLFEIVWSFNSNWVWPLGGKTVLMQLFTKIVGRHSWASASRKLMPASAFQHAEF